MKQTSLKSAPARRAGRWTALLALFLSCTCLLCACGREGGRGSITVDGRQISLRSVLKLDGEAVPFDLYRYCYLVSKDKMEAAESGIDWSLSKNREQLQEQTLEQIKNLYAVRDLAQEYGCSLTSDERAEIDSALEDAFKSAGGAADYKALLAENYLNHALYVTLYERNRLQQKMQESLIGTAPEKNKIVLTEQQALESYNAENCRLNCLYFLAFDELGEDQTSESLSAEQQAALAAAAKKKADAAHARLESGQSFETVMRAELGDEAYEADGQSYYSAEEILEHFNFDIHTLKVGEYSPVLELQGNCYILYRLENDEKFLKQNISAVVSNITSQRFDALIQEKADGYRVEKLSHYDEITPDTLQ